MFWKKKKTSFPKNAKLVCCSEEEYKNLLRQEIILKQLTDRMQKHNDIYEISDCDIRAIGITLNTHFDRIWNEVMSKCETINNGLIKIMQSAIDEMVGEKNET